MEPHKVLILNRSFEPLQVCDVRRAIVLLFTGRAERVEDTTDLMRSPSFAMLIPSVIRLQRYIRRAGSHALSFNKKNILKRDWYTCQYCGRNGGGGKKVGAKGAPRSGGLKPQKGAPPPPAAGVVPGPQPTKATLGPVSHDP